MSACRRYRTCSGARPGPGGDLPAHARGRAALGGHQRARRPGALPRRRRGPAHHRAGHPRLDGGVAPVRRPARRGRCGRGRSRCRPDPSGVARATGRRLSRTRAEPVRGAPGDALRRGEPGGGASARGGGGGCGPPGAGDATSADPGSAASGRPPGPAGAAGRDGRRRRSPGRRRRARGGRPRGSSAKRAATSTRRRARSGGSGVRGCAPRRAWSDPARPRWFTLSA